MTEANLNHLLDKGGEVNRSTLMAAPSYFGSEDMTQYAHAFGVGVQVLGALTAPFFPVAGVALSVAGVVGEDAWKAVSSGRDLTKNPFIEDDPGETDRTMRLILAAGCKRRDEFPAFAGALDSPLVRQRMGVDFNASRETLLDQLPSTLKEVVTQALSETKQDLHNDATLQTQVVTTIMARISEKQEQLEKQLKDYGELLRRQHEREDREAARAQIAALQNDVVAGINIAMFVLGRATGDKQKTQEIAQVLSGVASVGFAIAMGNWMGAVSMGLGMLQGFGSNPMAPIMAYLEQFGRRLDQLRTEMHERFDRLELQQQEMLVQLSQIYQAVSGGILSLSNQIGQLRQRFEDYWTVTDQDKRQDDIGSVYQAFSQAVNVQTAHKTGWETAFVEKLPKFVRHAKQKSRASYYRGVSGTAPGAIATEIQARKDADKLVALVPAICAKASVPVPADLPNPFALELGAEAYMQADLLLGSIKNAGREPELLDMWNDSISLRNALNTVSSQSVLKRLIDSCATEAGTNVDSKDALPATLIGTIRTIYEKWVTEKLKPHYTAEKIGRPPLSLPLPELVYEIFFDNYRVKSSPIEEAISLKLIELQEIKHEQKFYAIPGNVESWFYYVKILKGPHAGQTFGKGTETFGYTRMVYLDHPPGESREFIMPLPAVGPGPDGRPVIQGSPSPIGTFTLDFMDYCERLLGFHYATETLLQFVDWARDPKTNVLSAFSPSWSDAASALRLAAAIGQWRCVDGPEIVGQTDVRNISMLTTAKEALDYIDRIIRDDSAKFLAAPDRYFATADPRQIVPTESFPTPDPFPTKLHGRVSDRVRADLIAIQNAPTMPDTRSIPVLDRLLRRLAGYMTAHGIEFPVPAVGSRPG